MINIEFRQWLEEEIKQRGWSYRELARRAHISPAGVSQVMTRITLPTFDFCNSVAQALKMPPEHLFRIAGLMDPIFIVNEDETMKQELDDYWQYLDRNERDTIITLVHALYEKCAEYKTRNDD